jgi:hypothetical protein
MSVRWIEKVLDIALERQPVPLTEEEVASAETAVAATEKQVEPACGEALEINRLFTTEKRSSERFFYAGFYRFFWFEQRDAHPDNETRLTLKVSWQIS